MTPAAFSGRLVWGGTACALFQLLGCTSGGPATVGGSGGSTDARADTGSPSPTGTGGNTQPPPPDSGANPGQDAGQDTGNTRTDVPPPRTEDGGVAPSMITMTAIGANGTVGLDWSRVAGATGYRIYWSTAGSVTPQTGQAIVVGPKPATVHRGLTNGMTYSYVVAAVTAAGEGPPSPQVTARPDGEWTIEELGSGDFDDIVTGARVQRLPIDRRIHILLLAEGYLDAELPIFHDDTKHNLDAPTNDVDRWIKEVFGLDPYSKFPEAYVIWTLPRASMTHSDGGMSAFGVDAPTAQGPLWNALDAAGTDAFPFPPTAASRNFIAVFLLFDPARMRAGVSGHATSCRSPTNTALTLRCNFGVGHAHEFTHSHSDVRDEYMENSNGVPSANELSNVAPSNRCAELPWQHLLAGKGINKTEQLVGAFGRPEHGFHSEFKCHMNGTHENGDVWCAVGESLTLRPNWFCQWCRELTAFRMLYRTGILPGTPAAAFATWKSMYREPFFTRFGFIPPAVIPQTVMCMGQAAKPIYEACVP